MPWPLTLLVANNVSRSVVLRRTNGVVVARHGYEATREAAMAAFAKSWHRGDRAIVNQPPIPLRYSLNLLGRGMTHGH